MKSRRVCALLQDKRYGVAAYRVLCECGGVSGIVDKAHIFSRSSYPKFRGDPRNIVLLSRVFHARLDAGYHPITNRYMGGDWCTRFMLSLVPKDVRESLVQDVALY